MKNSNGRNFGGKSGGKPPRGASPRRADKDTRGSEHKRGDKRGDKTARPRHDDRPKRDDKPFHAAPRPVARVKEQIIRPAPLPKVKADLFGMHAVREAWNNPARKIHALYLTDTSFKGFAEHLHNNLPRPAPIMVTKEQLDRSLPSGSVHQGMAISCAPLPETGVDDFIIRAVGQAKTLLVMLDQVTDPHNVGAILRSCSAFGAAGVILQRMHAPELTGVLAKTACGAVEHMPVAYETNLTRALQTLQDAGFMAVGLDERGDAELSQLPVHPKMVLVLGAEGDGIRRLIKEQCDVLARLPTSGAIASLNVSNAAAVGLYAISHSR